MNFNELTLPEALMKGIADAGFSSCTPIQEHTLPISLTGKDIAGQAQTGTGKTAAFGLPLLQVFFQKADDCFYRILNLSS